MAILQVRDIDDQLYSALKNLAKRENRSLSQEVVHILETHLGESVGSRATQTEEFLSLSGAFQGESPKKLIQIIRKGRHKSRRFSAHGLFD